jgi:hypothetical protein
MAELAFTTQLQRFGLRLPTVQAPAPTLAALLDLGFAQAPELRDYVLDEQGGLRPHVAVFVDGRRCTDLAWPLAADSRVFVMQALSGG